MSDLVKRCRDGMVYLPKRWSGDTHYNNPQGTGCCDEDATEELLAEAADEIDRLQRELTTAGEMIIRLAEDNVRLNKIVEKLPTDGDGMPIVPGVDTVWCPDGHYDNVEMPLKVNGSGQAVTYEGRLFTSHIGGRYVFASQCYYTQSRAREVRRLRAEAARQAARQSRR